MDDLKEIQEFLYTQLQSHAGPLQVRGIPGESVEAKGTKEVMQGRQKVDGHYFASIVPKPKDVRFYYFPIYTHVDAFSLSPELRKCLKGKSCFHIKKLSKELQEEVKEMVDKGADLYKKDGLI